MALLHQQYNAGMLLYAPQNLFLLLGSGTPKNIYWKHIYNVCNFCKQTSLCKHLVIRFLPPLKKECHL